MILETKGETPTQIKMKTNNCRIKKGAILLFLNLKYEMVPKIVPKGNRQKIVDRAQALEKLGC
ncbi:hypothetical protein ABS210_19280, partial [Acinetobacter pittii]